MPAFFATSPSAKAQKNTEPVKPASEGFGSHVREKSVSFFVSSSDDVDHR
jgi:hypothetical protein